MLSPYLIFIAVVLDLAELYHSIIIFILHLNKNTFTLDLPSTSPLCKGGIILERKRHCLEWIYSFRSYEFISDSGKDQRNFSLSLQHNSVLSDTFDIFGVFCEPWSLSPFLNDTETVTLTARVNEPLVIQRHIEEHKPRYHCWKSNLWNSVKQMFMWIQHQQMFSYCFPTHQFKGILLFQIVC